MKSYTTIVHARYQSPFPDDKEHNHYSISIFTETPLQLIRKIDYPLFIYRNNLFQKLYYLLLGIRVEVS